MKIYNAFIKTFFCFLLSVASLSHSQDAMDGYYSNDLLDAVHEAKQAPHHYDYSNTYRYKRTTAQSIEMDRLDLDEMEETGLAGALDAPASGEDTTQSEEDIAQVDEQTLRKDRPELKPEFSLPTQAVVPQNTIISHSNNGITSTQGIHNSSTLVSTPRP